MIFRDFLDKLYEKRLISEIKYVPQHIAIIQDGNRRYAMQKGIDIASGHRLGAETTGKVLNWAQNIGVHTITLYCFSTENFNRSEEELHELFNLFSQKAEEALSDARMHKYKIRIQMLGDRSMIPKDLIKKIETVEELTKNYCDFTINLAIAYGGRNEIVSATRSILTKIQEKAITPDEINIGMFEKNLYNNTTIPPVDLIIRTGNEKRISNFLPWLANGNESAVYFCAPFWPMFRKIDLLRGIRIYDQRMRNLKKISE